MTFLEPIRQAFRGPQWKPTVILLTSPVLLLAWKYGFAPEVFRDGWGQRTEDPASAGAIYHFLGCLVLLGLIPAFLVKGLFREQWTDYGVCLGCGRRTFASLALLAPVFLLLAYLSSSDPHILAKFPINPRAGASPAMFALHAATYFLYYLGWEFYFRGYLLFGLRQSLGDANAVLVQTLASALLHIGSPAAETFGSILGGLLWGMLALYTRSLLSGLGQHFLLGIALDAFICLT